VLPNPTSPDEASMACLFMLGILKRSGPRLAYDPFLMHILRHKL